MLNKSIIIQLNVKFMLVGTTGEKVCPVNGVINLLSRKWVFGILKDIFMGKHHFTEFKEDKPEISNVVLRDTLVFLENEGLIYKVTREDSYKNIEYYLTEKGEKFNKILYEMVIFGLYVLEDDLRSDKMKKQLKEEYEEILNIK